MYMEPRSNSANSSIKLKICFVGDFAVGKTSIADRFVHDRFRTAYVPTIGTQILKKDFYIRNPRTGGRLKVDMTIWDIMGQKGFRELLHEAYFYGAKGVLSVFDITREETLKDLEYWIDSVLRVTGRIPIQILANKIDLKDQMAVSENQIMEIAERYTSEVQYTSAKTGENVDHAFVKLAENFTSRVLAPKKSGSVVALEGEP